MLIDEEDKRPVKGPKPLDKMSVEELEDYIQDLKTEIVRVEKDIAKKKAHAAAAASIFKS